MKEFLLYTVLLLSLATAIVLPDGVLWASLMRGALLGVFIVTIPEYVREKSGQK